MELSQEVGGGGDTSARSPGQVHVITVQPTDPDEDEDRKRRDLLSRRPSYRKILNDLSSEPGHTKSESGQNGIDSSEGEVSLKTPVIPSPASLQTVTVLPQTIQLADSQGLQTLTMTNASSTAQSQTGGATIVQYAQSADGQFFIPVAGSGVQAYQITTPTSLPQGVVMTSSGLGSPQGIGEEASRKRELRLLKNREAARECRRKKKDYVKCLENRVAVLENQNKQLIEELKSLKELYCQKEAGVVPDSVTILQTTLQ